MLYMFVNQDFKITDVKESHQGSSHLRSQRDLASQGQLVSACVFYKKRQEYENMVPWFVSFSRSFQQSQIDLSYKFSC